MTMPPNVSKFCFDAELRVREGEPTSDVVINLIHIADSQLYCTSAATLPSSLHTWHSVTKIRLLQSTFNLEVTSIHTRHPKSWSVYLNAGKLQ